MDIEKIFIKSVRINQVRHLENIEIIISETKKKHLIITGKNGSGKTSVMESIAKYLKSVYYDNFNISAQYDTIRDYEAHLGRLNEQLASSSKNDSTRYLNTEISKFKTAVIDIKESIDEVSAASVVFNNDLSLPQHISEGKFIIDFEKYYRVNDQSAVEGAKLISFKKQNVPDANISNLFSQFLTNQRMDMLNHREEGNEGDYRKLQDWFERINEIFRKVFDDEELNLKFNTDRKIFEVVQKDKIPFALNELSSGYSSYFKIVNELLLRMDSLTQGNYSIPGICLIDEIETHLHIELQHKALTLLTAFFPNIQFIVTTHSPFVVNSIENCKVYDLENGYVIEDPSRYSSDAITKIYFKADKYSDELKLKIKRYEELSNIKDITQKDQAEYISLKEYFNEVPTQFSPELKSVLLDIKLKSVLR